MRRLLLVLLLTTSALAQQPRPDLADELTIDSKILGQQRTAIVRLPASYHRGIASYPVLYMTDGDAHAFHTAGTIDFLSRNGRMPEVILVAIRQIDRMRELTPTHVETAQGEIRRFQTSGGGDAFLDFVATELVPEIERNYRTQPYRVLLGHSLGGMFALHAAFRRPELFAAWIAVSPALQWDNGLVLREASEFFDRNRNARGTLVFSVGDEGAEMGQWFADLSRLLKKRAPKSFEWQALRMEDEDHGTTVLPTHFEGLKTIFAPWRFPLNGNEDPRALPARLREHYGTLSKRVGYAVPVPEATRNVIAYRLLQADQIDSAIALFEENVAAWPSSPNVYDSLGEAFETKKDFARAKANYAKAVELGAKSGDPNLAIFRRNLERATALVESPR